MGVLKQIFWCFGEQRLRAGWRILIYTLLWIIAPAIVGRVIGGWLLMPLTSAFPTVAGFAPHAVAVLVKLLVVIICTWLAARWLDRRPLADFGLRFDRFWWLDFSFGLGLGALLMSLIFLVEWLAGWVVVTDTLPRWAE